MWLIGCGYWLYQFIIIDAQPKENMGLVLNDSRDALVILFFGIIGFGFAVFIAFFIIKLIYNLFHDGIESSFPMRWHSIVKPVSYMVILYFAFSFTGTIKVAGLTAYNQFIAIVETSRRQDMIIKKELPEDFERKMNELIRLFDENDGE